MEKESAKNVGGKESREVLFKAGSYAVSVRLIGNKIQFKANSDILGKLFLGSFAESEMTDFQKEYLSDVTGVFELIEECVSEKRQVELSDTGKLKFVYVMKLSRKNQVSKTLDFDLKEVEISEMQRLVMRVDRLERQNNDLKNRLERLWEAGEFPKMRSVIDLNTTHARQLTINGQEIFSNKGAGQWSPVFLEDKLVGKQSFQIEISSISSNGVMVGVAAENLKNSANCYSNVDSVCMYPAGSCLYYAGSSKSASHSWTNGDRMTVKVDLIKNTIEWESSYPLIKQIVKCAIPSGMTGKNLYPVLHMLDSYSDRIRFV